MEVVEFPSYIEEEKIQIARHFLIPRQIEEHGLTEHPPRFPESTLQRLIREYTYEPGVRNLEREIAALCRKAARRLAAERRPLRQFAATALPRHLGPPRYLRDRTAEKDEVGLATSLAWTEGGGDLLTAEVTLMPGKSGFTLTGQMGEVMRESAQAALSYARALSEELDLPEDTFDKLDIHIHLPEVAIPKDGPSAGITMATALVSALSGRPVRRDVGMTGEVTLRGRVLPVGGLKEKIVAAHRAGLKTVVIPKQNEADLADIPRKVLKDLRVVLVEHMDEVLETALLPPEESPEEQDE